ncbi:PREDICTED: uncharacterized protein LOC109587333 [Amphimedon queenslandica]|uniref:Uncharacterized protein n=2 Tax=Amphimedon queenslandica TaxID=400682 RepID=A0AAN0JQN3_AMPQE|nr:PREDICTED: uncharacterized protein LOC109587333 [Amphimedon queenslandica]|eukprot:XP_019859133.1 PREDICTED: uncharacterized protein LOC109587333 [Amphimedon queenslandica]
MAARRLISQDNQLGIMVKKRFQSKTNFSVSIASFVTTPKNMVNPLQGFVYQVTTSDGERMECFVDHDSAQTLTSFCKVLRRFHPEIPILNDKLQESLWVEYIFDKTRAFCQDPDRRRQTVVTCLGRQPNSAVWVFGPNVQLNERGRLIAEDQRKYYWVPNYTPLTDLSRTLSPAEIHLPLSRQALITLLETGRQCLGSNFMSCYAAIAGSVVLFHYETIMEAQAECPVILGQTAHTNGSTIHAWE